jgi:O-antigen/teichoic acid export membrane protein
MSKKNFFSDLSASTVNKLFTNIQASLFFLIISIWLPKSELGIYAWCLSIAALLAQAQTLGTAQPMVRRIAAQAEQASIVTRVSLFIRCAMAAAILLVLLPIAWPLRSVIPHLKLLVAAYLVMSINIYSLASSQTLQANQRFWGMTLTDQSGLMIKLVLGVTFVYLGFGVPGLFAALAVSFMVAATVGFSLASSVGPRLFLPLWNRQELMKLLREGLPLLPMPLLAETLARADWILLGFLKTDVVVAEYAFSYRVYEICNLPAAILGVVLLPKLSSWLRGLKFDAFQKESLPKLIRVVIAVSALIPINMVIAWTPVIDAITVGKYGAVNQTVVTVLAFCTPFFAGEVIYWSIFLATVRNKKIMVITLLTCLVNVALNLLLIPGYGALGAAMANVATTAVHFFGYFFALGDELKRVRVLITITLVTALAVGAVLAAKYVVGFWPVQCALASAIYLVGILLIDRVPWRDALDLFGEKLSDTSQESES